MDRNQAIERLRRAIDEYAIQGVETTLDFGRFVLDHPAFVSGKFDTGFVGYSLRRCQRLRPTTKPAKPRSTGPLLTAVLEISRPHRR